MNELPGGVSAALLTWYDGGHRDLPWRRDPTPYETLVSELMLQQTVVATVEPYYHRFIARFPTVQALAAATDDEVAAIWSGLGYYARARNLRQAAATIVAEHGGVFPDTEPLLRSLPGIGEYTAAAVAAIAFGVRTFALDGNGARVLARLTAEQAPIDLPATRRRLRALGAAAVPADRPGDFNQAVMELGARVCTPRRARCDLCPVASACAGRAARLVDELPRKRPPKPRPVVRVVCACVTDGERVLVERRPSGLLRGTWALPEEQLEATVAERGEREDGTAVARRLAEGAGAAVRAVAYSGAVRHVFTHRDVTADVFLIEGQPRAPVAPSVAERRWVAMDGLGGLGLSTFARKTLAAARGSTGGPSRS